MTKQKPTKEELYELYINQNLSRKKIAERFGYSEARVKQWLKEYTIVKPRKLITQAIEQGKIDKYGTIHYSNEEKRKATCLERYGVSHVLQNKDIMEKRNNTCLERYGDAHFTNIEKARQTKLEKYGNKKKEKLPKIVKEKPVKIVKNKPILDEAYYNNMNIDISFNDCLKELKNLRKVKGCGYSYGNRWNEIVLYYQWKEFYKKELELWDNPEFRRRLVENRVKYINKGFGQLTHRNILQGFKISGLYVGFSHHCPMWIKQFLEDFHIKSVYDPCGGWGHRMIGSQSLETEVTYIYNDINTVVYNNCCKMANDLNFSNVKFYNNDAGKFTPEEDYEAVFTCPPYWNKEIYSNIGAENLSYEQFLKWWDTVVKSSLKPSVKLFAFVISNDLLSDMVSVCLDNGLKMLSIQALNNRSNYNHFERKSFSKKSEKLVIFEKFLN